MSERVVSDKGERERVEREVGVLRAREKAIEEWFREERRWKGKYRNYSARDVACLRGTVTEQLLAHHTSEKLYTLLRRAQAEGGFSHTFGCLDTVMASNQALAGLTSIYISGWQCSSTHTSNNEFGPDFADYPADTVPSKVQQIARSLVLRDRIQNEERARLEPAQLQVAGPPTDYLLPIVADADAGFGGVTSVMKLTKMFIEAGAAAIHLEDQRPSSKKCGHLGGKVLVSVREAMEKLNAARLQADVMGVGLVIMARTDALAAKFLDNNCDPVDQPFILGVVDPSCPDKLMTFVEAGELWLNAQLASRPEQLKASLDLWKATAQNFTLSQAHDFMRAVGIDSFYFDWEACRSPEGFYRVQGSIDYCVRRCSQFAKIADLLWMETATPNLEQARQFAEGVRRNHPLQMFAYNNSPSFNWDAAGLSDAQIEDFIPALGRLGFCFQFITLAGFHLSALHSTTFARDYKARNMLAYVQTVQREERDRQVAQLKHQQWSGVELKDRELHLASGGVTSTKATGRGNTETQFAPSSPSKKLAPKL